MDNQYHPWEEQGISEAAYWKHRFSEAAYWKCRYLESHKEVAGLDERLTELEGLVIGNIERAICGKPPITGRTPVYNTLTGERYPDEVEEEK